MNKRSYAEFIKNKQIKYKSAGFDITRGNINDGLFDFQKDITKWSIKKGRSAIFAGTGLGKTRMQIEYGQKVYNEAGGNILILAPLTVSSQTKNEALKIGYEVNLCRSQKDVRTGLNITNYEMLHAFNPKKFNGIILDESSILKSFTGKIRNEIIESFKDVHYRLACTATPAPNDYMELGNHAEFLGVMKRSEMLAMFFVHDGGNTSKWRLKKHAEKDFWQWVASWAVMLEKPSDLGYSDEGYILPPLNIEDYVVQVPGDVAKTLSQRQRARRETIEERVKVAVEKANSIDRPLLIWCGLNDESSLLKSMIPDAVEVKGSDSAKHKEKSLLGFSQGDIRVLITKPSIAGFGMNWQHCSDMDFVGLNDSFEQVFQAIRRCYRFGQINEVNVRTITSSREGAVAENIKRKEIDYRNMLNEMIKHTKDITAKNIRATQRDITNYDTKYEMKIPEWLRGEKRAS